MIPDALSKSKVQGGPAGNAARGGRRKNKGRQVDPTRRRIDLPPLIRIIRTPKAKLDAGASAEGVKCCYLYKR